MCPTWGVNKSVVCVACMHTGCWGFRVYEALYLEDCSIHQFEIQYISFLQRRMVIIFPVIPCLGYFISEIF